MQSGNRRKLRDRKASVIAKRGQEYSQRPTKAQFEAVRLMMNSYKEFCDKYTKEYTRLSDTVARLVTVVTKPNVTQLVSEDPLMLRFAINDVVIELPHQTILKDPPVLNYVLYQQYEPIVNMFKKQLSKAFENFKQGVNKEC